MPKNRRPAWPQTIIKALFGRASNQCSICKAPVTELPKTPGDKIAVIGQIAHINAISSDGPRGSQALTVKELNDYDNLILLCANCHAKIDRQEITFSANELRKIKLEHESRNSVSRALDLTENDLVAEFSGIQERLINAVDESSAFGTIEDYTSQFQSFWEDTVSEFIPGEYSINGQVVGSSMTGLSLQIKNNTVIFGASGNGKSLLAKSLGIRSIDANEIPILIDAFQFEGSVKQFLFNESGLIMGRFEQIYASCLRLGRRLLLVIDGFNECSDRHRPKLAKWLSSIAQHPTVRVVVTTQAIPREFENTSFEMLWSQPPSMVLKERIIRARLKDVDWVKIRPLVEAVTTCLEVRLIAEVAQSLPKDSSRFALFDLFARQQLKENAEIGVAILSFVAEFMFEEIKFSISVREFSRIIAAAGIRVASTDFLFQSRLLLKRADRVIFNHELFLNAFSGEAVVRRANNDATALITRLSNPVHRDHWSFIVGAVDDTSLLTRILPRLDNSLIIESILLGYCGAYSNRWAIHQCTLILSKMRREAASIAFIEAPNPYYSDGRKSIGIDPATRLDWTTQKICFIHLFAILLVKGQFWQEIFEVIGIMDDRILSERRRLRVWAKENNVALNSPMFEQIYLGWTSDMVSVGMVLSNFITGGWRDRDLKPTEALGDHLMLTMGSKDTSPGQLFLALHLVQYFRFSRESLGPVAASFLPTILSERWRYFPYHLQLIVLSTAEYSNNASQDLKDAIIEALNELLKETKDDWISSTSIIEALQNLGGLKEDEIAHEDTVRSELTRILSDEHVERNCIEAYGFHIRSIDHPFFQAYWEVIQTLSEKENKTIYSMALKGAALSDRSVFGLPSLLYQVLKFKDPLSSSLFEPFLALPKVDESMQQDALEVLLLAHVGLGILGYDLKSQVSKTESLAAKSIIAYSEILYWQNRKDVNDTQKNLVVDELWKILLDTENYFALDTLRVYGWMIHNNVWRLEGSLELVITIEDRFSHHLVQIARQGLSNGEKQMSYFRFSKPLEIVTHGIHLIAHYGDERDVPLLRNLTAIRELSAEAVSAIADIDYRKV